MPTYFPCIHAHYFRSRSACAFADGDFITAFVEIAPGVVRFFNDGRVVLHFLGLGVRLENEIDTEFSSVIAASNGVSFSEDGEIEVRPEEGAIGFAKYMSSMRAVISWEKARETAMANARSLALAK